MGTRGEPVAGAVPRGLPTVGVPAPAVGRGWWRGARPLMWLLLAAASLWPLTGAALGAAGLVLAGAVTAVAADRDPDVVSGRGAARRVALLAVTALTGLAAVLVEPRGLGYASAFVAATMIARLVGDRRVVAVFAAVLAVLVAVVVLTVSASPWAVLAAVGVPLLASRAWSRAEFHREHVRVVALLAERDALRGAEIAAAAASSAAEERARIARDLHDVLAHTLSGLSLHLQGIRAVLARRSVEDDPVIAQVDRAADLARTGLAEAKEAVAALRAPHASAADVERLAREHGASLTVHGDLDACPAPWREAAVATVREGLTNAGRHAPGATAAVTVDARDGLVVRVADAGAEGGPTDPADAGGGQGLAGLAERAALVGGSLDSGRDGSGWQVTLRVLAPERVP